MRKTARIFGDIIEVERYKICIDVLISAACEALKRRKSYFGTENKDNETKVKSNGVTGLLTIFTKPLRINIGTPPSFAVSVNVYVRRTIQM